MILVMDRYGRQRYEPDSYVIQDGESLHAPMHMMDSRAEFERARGRVIANDHRPGFRTADSVTQAERSRAYYKRKQQLSDAWRNPIPNARTSAPQADRNRAFIGREGMTREEAREAYKRWLSTAWKGGAA